MKNPGGIIYQGKTYRAKRIKDAGDKTVDNELQKHSDSILFMAFIYHPTLSRVVVNFYYFNVSKIQLIFYKGIGFLFFLSIKVNNPAILCEEVESFINMDFVGLFMSFK